MVPWYLVIIAGEIGVFIGFIIAATIAFFQIKRFNKSIFANSFPIKEKKIFDILTSSEKQLSGECLNEKAR